MDQHNPVAHIIYQLQSTWAKHTEGKSYKLVRWLIEKENLELFKGFLKLESTPHGSVEETFVIMFTPFSSADDFAYDISKDWLELFHQEMETNTYQIPEWKDFGFFYEQIKDDTLEFDADRNTKFFREMLQSFKIYEGNPDALVVGLLPDRIADEKGYRKWVEKITTLLPHNIALMTVDFEGQEFLKDLFSKNDPEYITIDARQLYDAQSIYRELATQGDPEDPQIAYRTCLFEMGDAAKRNNKKGIYHWGDKALLITQSTGDRIFWASTYLTYAGFLFGLKDTDKIMSLFDTGEKICKPLLEDESTQVQAVGLLAQFYSFKASYYSIIGKPQDALDYFKKQAHLLTDHQQDIMAITAYQNALIVASKHAKDELAAIANDGFSSAYGIEDNQLMGTSFSIIAYYYLEFNEVEPEFKQEIINRLDELFGEGWMDSAKKHLVLADPAYLKQD